MSDTTVETVESNEKSTKIQNVANGVALGFAVIGAVQTTRFAIAQVRSGIRIAKTAHAAKTAAETPTES